MGKNMERLEKFMKEHLDFQKRICQRIKKAESFFCVTINIDGHPEVHMHNVNKKLLETASVAIEYAEKNGGKPNEILKMVKIGKF